MSEEITAIRVQAPMILCIFTATLWWIPLKSSTLEPLVFHIKLLNLNEKDNYHLISLAQPVLNAHTY